MEEFVYIFFSLLAMYILAGIVFALVFIVKGMTSVDPSTKDTSMMFKLLIFPGMVALWPVLALKWRRNSKKSK